MAIIFLAVSCAEGPIADRGSRADRVFDMANDGDSTAQTALGLLYERGLGVPRDPALALVWYRRAAAEGDALAEFHIGSLYERGAGVELDYAEAAIWYLRAAEKGNESAQAALAYLYDRGLGVERDFAKAEALYSQASATWAEIDNYPAEADFATGRDGPALAGPTTSNVHIGEQPPEFSAGKKEAPAIEIDLAALDDVPEPLPAATVFDGPQPIAGRGENFPLAAGSLTPPEQSRVPEPGDPLTGVQRQAAEDKVSALPLPPGPKPGQPARVAPPEKKAAVAPPEPAAAEAPQEPQAVEVSDVPPAPSGAPEAESQATKNEAKLSAAEEQEATFQLGEAEEKLITSLEEELDDEAAAFEVVLDAAVDDAEEDVLESLPPVPEIFLISLATFESEALAEAEWTRIKKTHAGLVGRLPYEMQPIDMGDEGKFFELIVGPLDSPVQSRLLCGALRTHGHVCRTIDK